ncbi:MAG: hypothetical protein R3C11_08085 [Planctomycetaceae bacterium]
MFASFFRFTMLIVYVSAMVISVVAHDPFHRHDHGSATDQANTDSHGHHSSEKHHHHGHHHHHHGHTHHHSKSESNKVAHNSAQHPVHHHEHEDENCSICEFLSLKCIEATLAEVESTSELITLASQDALCYHVAFSPFQPPSRAPPAC